MQQQLGFMRIFAMSLCFTLMIRGFGQNHQAPVARSGYSLAYDASRDVVVLFGGQDSANARLSDTWEWSAGVWSRIEVGGPSARMNAAMAYDPVRKLVFLFGGRTESGTEDDLWTYDGKSWSNIEALSRPPRRQQGTMVFDKGQSQFLLFGGLDVNKNSLGDTWVLKDKQWTMLNSNGPSPRSSHAMTYDDDMQAAVLYGGYINETASREFWELKDGVWHAVTGNNGPVRLHESISYDPDKKRLLLFGGFNERERTNELWEYAKDQWSLVAVGKDKIPDPRAEHRSVFIPGQGLFIFGGVIGPDGNTRIRGNDTWLFDGKSWVRLN
jgi:hypothetical protein